ncbi:MAG TPA: class I adenylate-forming enzyme family protein [Ilumatobacteraceae bacterium]|nr:class I adenylate-forming enzyme family protein [Ilumatobacteraceae bacterium]HRB01966.1 class I adenylate-forming enzyme family protein [Ilumatobacteraceae bacterium]
MTVESGSIDAPIRRATFGDQLRRNAARLGDHPAIVALHSPLHERRVLTYRQLNERANRLAHSFAAQGVGLGDVVAIMGRNSPESVIAFWAAAKLGAACTGVNYTFTAREIHYQLDHSEAKVLVCEDAFVSKIEALEQPLPNLTVRVVNSAYSDTAPAAWLRLDSLIADGLDIEPDVDVCETTLGIIPYTSGTEALPKAVAIPQRNYFISMIPSYVTGIGLVEEDVWYYTMPFHTIAGMGMQIALLCLGNTIVLPFAVDPANALKAFVDEGVTVVGQTPTFYLQVIQAPGFESADLSRIRRAITYGGTMPRAMFEGFTKASPNLEWVTLWSQSELTQTPTIGRFKSLDDVPNHDPAWIGRPTAQLELRVVDDNGNDAAEGELICRSPGVMRGYYKNPEKTAEVLRDGWLHTGDNVRIDEAGNLFFMDRQKDMIKTGGMNVSSVEVERVLYQHGSIMEAAVVGMADEYWSQLVTAFVVPRKDHTIDPEEVRTFCKEHLAGYKVPKVVTVVAELPKDTQGKILKRNLRQQPAPPPA